MIPEFFFKPIIKPFHNITFSSRARLPYHRKFTEYLWSSREISHPHPNPKSVKNMFGVKNIISIASRGLRVYECIKESLMSVVGVEKKKKRCKVY